MEDESSVDIYMYAVLVVLGIIGYFIRKALSKKTIAELQNFADSHNYVYTQKVEDNSIIKQLDFPKIYTSVRVYNYMEIPEKNWTAFWGDCDRDIHAKGAPTSTARATFYVFKFDNVIIPEFEVTDNQGVIGALGNLFSGKVIKMDGGFGDSYTLKSSFEAQTKKFFTEKGKKAFLNLDKNHLPEERNLDVKDLGNMITGHFGKAGIQIYGGNKKIIVFSSEKTSLDARQKFYKIASGIANAVVQGAPNSNSSSSNLSNAPKDDLSQFLANQESSFNAIPKKNQNAQPNNQIPAAAPYINNVREEAEPQYAAPEQTYAQEQSYVAEQPYVQQQSFIQQQPFVQQQPSVPEQPSVGLPDLDASPNNYSEQESQIDPSEQLLFLAAMMVVDKSIHRNELKIIVDYGVQMGMERAEIERIVTFAKAQPDKVLHSAQLAAVPKNNQLMHMIVRVAFADGKIASEELEFLRLIAKKMNYSNEELKVILEEEKRNFHS